MGCGCCIALQAAKVSTERSILVAQMNSRGARADGTENMLV